MKFTAAGDIIIQIRRQNDFFGFEELAPFIKQGDARFFNLETTINYEGECNSSQLSGGTYIRTNPEVLEDIKNFGFNMTSFNNNHAMDFSVGGFLKTLEYVNKSGFVHSGAGYNLAEASAPKYLETNAGRVALIAVNTNFSPDMLAGEQTPRVPGRPGINGLRLDSYVELPKEDLEVIKRIAKETNINASKEITRAEGYYPELVDNEAEFGEMKFVEGEKSRFVRHVNKKDMARVEKAIYEAQLQADYIIVSVHSHQLTGDKKENPSDFLEEFAHACIDMGAHAIVGHGPHLLRPIEVYKGCPIFYSLGDFVLQLYNIELAPEEFFEKYGLSAATSTVHELLKKRSKDFTVGLMTDKRMFQAVIPLWETKNNKLVSLKLMPVEAAMEGNKSEIGLPRRSDGYEICEYLNKMCEPYGTRVVREEDGILRVEWEDK